METTSVTTANITNNQVKKRSIIGSIAGVSLGLGASIALTKKGQPIKDVFVKGDITKTAKNLYNYTKVDYEGLNGFLAMTLQAGGAALGSLLGGLSAYKNEPQTEKIEADKKTKIKEALFMTNNVLVPTAFVKGGEWGLEKIKEISKSDTLQSIASNKLTKHLTTALALVGGMISSMNLTNLVNTKFIEKENADNKKMRPIDFIYHVDDIIPILIASKNPICDKLPIDRLLPVIYGYMGSEIGQKTKENEGHHHH